MTPLARARRDPRRTARNAASPTSLRRAPRTSPHRAKRQVRDCRSRSRRASGCRSSSAARGRVLPPPRVARWKARWVDDRGRAVAQVDQIRRVPEALVHKRPDASHQLASSNNDLNIRSWGHGPAPRGQALPPRRAFDFVFWVGRRVAILTRSARPSAMPRASTSTSGEASWSPVTPNVTSPSYEKIVTPNRMCAAIGT